MKQPNILTARTHRLYSHLNDEELELFRSAMELCGYTTSGQFAREVLCSFSMRAITKYTTPKIVNDVLTESINNHGSD